MAQTALRTVTLDGEAVTVRCDRLTLRVYNHLCSYMGVRGAGVSEGTAMTVSRAEAIDAHIRAVDGVEDERGCLYTGPLAKQFGLRAQPIGTLFTALLSAQRLSDDERHDLEVAVRFSVWLEKAWREKSESHWAQTGTSCYKCHELKLCGRRGCDGTEKKRVVWHSGPIILKRCPMLSFKPDIEEVLRLFYWTHDMTSTLRWEQRHILSETGQLLDQDAWLVEAFSFLRQIHATIVRENHA